jgi:hypothetical protein
MSDAADSETFGSFARGRAWRCFRSMASQTKTGRSGNRERSFILRQVVEKRLVPGQIETNDPSASKSRRRPRHSDVRFGVMVPERCNHHAGANSAAIHSLTNSIANGGHDRVHIETQMHVSRRTEAKLQIIGAIRGGIFHGLAGNSGDVRRRSEEWIGSRDLG